MKAFSILFIGVGLISLLTGCDVVSLNPLLDPANAKEDKQLLGRWRSIGQDKTCYVQFENANGHEVKISFQGEEVDAELRNGGLRGFTTKIGGYRYINVMPSEPEDKGYLIAQYRIEKDIMTIWVMDIHEVKKAIAEGRVKGTPGQGLFPTATITDTSQHIVTFIESSPGGLFEKFAAFEKVKSRP